MELPDYDECHYTSSNSSSSSSNGRRIGQTVSGAIRFLCYVVVLVLLGYYLWRIRAIESVLAAQDRYTNITRNIVMETSLQHRRVERSVNNNLGGDDLRINYPNSPTANGNGGGIEKSLPRGTMLTAKNEDQTKKKKQKPLIDEENFDYLVNVLIEKIRTMHNDKDRGHFDRNIKAVFQAWFPVFDALLPREFMGNNQEAQNVTTRTRRWNTKSSEESSEEKSRNKNDQQPLSDNNNNNNSSIHGGGGGGGGGSRVTRQTTKNVKLTSQEEFNRINKVVGRDEKSSEESSESVVMEDIIAKKLMYVDLMNNSEDDLSPSLKVKDASNNDKLTNAAAAAAAATGTVALSAESSESSE